MLGLIGMLAALPALGYALVPRTYDDPDDLYSALRSHAHTRMDFPEGRIDVAFADGAVGVNRTKVLAWVRRSGTAVATYFGRFPVRHLGLLIVAEDSAKVGHATTFGYAGSATRIHVGAAADDAAFARDWVLVHEMMHSALPNLPRRALWLQEGNATYVEPIARAQAGQLPVEDVWRQSVAGMPKGIPHSDDGGMDGTEAWGRLYWGGATFWLLAEVAIYQDSKGRFLLRDALRAINRRSGGNTVEWTPEQLMQAGDIATGTTALSKLYAQFVAGRIDVDLAALFSRLGILANAAGDIRFDDRAPLAELRRSITHA